jgi:hypothetical protein
LRRTLIVAQATGGVGKTAVVRGVAEAVRNSPMIKFGPRRGVSWPDFGQFKKRRLIRHAPGLTERTLVVRPGGPATNTKSARLADLSGSTALRGSAAR